MFHPAKPWRMSLSSLCDIHTVTRQAPDIFGGARMDPTGLFSNPGGYSTLKGADLFVRDQLASGTNAVLWRDPSFIL